MASANEWDDRIIALAPLRWYVFIVGSDHEKLVRAVRR